MAKRTEKRFKVIPTSHLILAKGGKILLLKRFNTGYEDGNYGVVAGHLDGNETVLQATAREAKEEAGIDVKPEDLEVVHVMHRKYHGGERMDFFVKANKWKGKPRIMEPDKCDDLSWFKINELPDNVIPYVRRAIGCMLGKIFYSEFGW